MHAGPDPDSDPGRLSEAGPLAAENIHWPGGIPEGTQACSRDEDTLGTSGPARAAGKVMPEGWAWPQPPPTALPAQSPASPDQSGVQGLPCTETAVASRQHQAGASC